VLYSYTAAASCWSATWPLGLGQTEQPLQQSQEARPPPRLQNGLYHWRIPHTQLLTRTLQGRTLRKSLFQNPLHPHCPLMSLHLFSASSTIQRADMFAARTLAAGWVACSLKSSVLRLPTSCNVGGKAEVSDGVIDLSLLHRHSMLAGHIYPWLEPQDAAHTRIRPRPIVTLIAKTPCTPDSPNPLSAKQPKNPHPEERKALQMFRLCVNPIASVKSCSATSS
jgi:hypothetical protein